MPKSSLADWSTTAGNNTDIGGVDIAENCPPAGINNALRELMAQIATWYTAITAGGTITGSAVGSDTTLTLDSADDAVLVLDKAASGDYAYILAKSGGADRWSIVLGDSAAESGSNAGANLRINSYDDAGAYIGVPLQIARSNGTATFSGTVAVAPTSPADPAHGIVSYSRCSDTPGETYYAVIGYTDDEHTQGGGLIGYSVNRSVLGISGYSSGATNYAFYGAGNGYLTGTWTEASDRKLKTDFQRIDNALDKVASLTGYTFNRVDLPGRHTGLIAQDVQAVLPEAVTDNDGTLGIAYGNLAGLLVEAIKELRAEVAELRSRMEGEP